MRKRRSQKKKGSLGSIVQGILRIVLRAILTPVTVVNVVLIINNSKDPSHPPGVAGYRPITVLSGSMESASYPGDVILTKDTENPSTLQVGDVICYQYFGKAATHRVAQALETEEKVSYVTKGDNNNVEDRLAVEPEQIEDVWSGTRIPALGNVPMPAQTSMGIPVLIIYPLTALFLWDLLKRRKNGSKEKKQAEELEVGLEALKMAQKGKTSGDA